MKHITREQTTNQDLTVNEPKNEGCSSWFTNEQSSADRLNFFVPDFFNNFQEQINSPDAINNFSLSLKKSLEAFDNFSFVDYQSVKEVEASIKSQIGMFEKVKERINVKSKSTAKSSVDRMINSLIIAENRVNNRLRLIDSVRYSNFVSEVEKLTNIKGGSIARSLQEKFIVSTMNHLTSKKLAAIVNKVVETYPENYKEYLKFISPNRLREINSFLSIKANVIVENRLPNPKNLIVLSDTKTVPNETESETIVQGSFVVEKEIDDSTNPTQPEPEKKDTFLEKSKSKLLSGLTNLRNTLDGLKPKREVLRTDSGDIVPDYAEEYFRRSSENRLKSKLIRLRYNIGEIFYKAKVVINPSFYRSDEDELIRRMFYLHARPCAFILAASAIGAGYIHSQPSGDPDANGYRDGYKPAQEAPAPVKKITVPTPRSTPKPTKQSTETKSSTIAQPGFVKVSNPQLNIKDMGKVSGPFDATSILLMTNPDGTRTINFNTQNNTKK